MSLHNLKHSPLNDKLCLTTKIRFRDNVLAADHPYYIILTNLRPLCKWSNGCMNIWRVQYARILVAINRNSNSCIRGLSWTDHWVQLCCGKIRCSVEHLKKVIVALEVKGEERLQKVVAIRELADYCCQCKPLCTKFQSTPNKRDILLPTNPPFLIVLNSCCHLLNIPFRLMILNATSGIGRACIYFSQVHNKKPE